LNDYLNVLLPNFVYETSCKDSAIMSVMEYIYNAFILKEEQRPEIKAFVGQKDK